MGESSIDYCIFFAPLKDAFNSVLLLAIVCQGRYLQRLLAYSMRLDGQDAVFVMLIGYNEKGIITKVHVKCLVPR